ncbi:MAG: TetR/AcrR family transcriptional regulator [Litoreibacter sp.]|uniref:TetR/AcrR family transcriptional regulator n=1 Tax=Litoreibacter sp. TaxID=1969459 RepID=UPI003297A4E4
MAIDVSAPETDVGPMKDQRQNQILSAAKTLFFERGLRATTMAAISEAAGIAKPTLYSRYKDKNAIFHAMIASILNDLWELMDAEFSKSGSIESRLTAALVAKYCAVFDMLQSPHVAQMMEDKVLYAGHAFEKLNTDVTKRIESMISEGGYTNPSELTHLILSCAFGIHRNAHTREDVARDITAVVYALLAAAK